MTLAQYLRDALIILVGLVGIGFLVKAIYLWGKIREAREFEYRNRFRSLPPNRRQVRTARQYVYVKKTKSKSAEAEPR